MSTPESPSIVPRAAALLLAAATALGAARAAGPDAADAAPQPVVQHAGSVAWVSGGVTLGEAARMKRLMADYPLRIVLSDARGEYAVASRLRILRDDGARRGETVAELSDAGPYVLVDLPPGRYTLQADIAGLSRSREVVVARGGATVRWAVPDAS